MKTPSLLLSLTLAVALGPRSDAAEILVYGLAKGTWHTQTSGAAPDSTPDAYEAFAYAAVSNPGNVVFGTVTPAGATIPLFLAPQDGSNLLVASGEFTSQAELDQIVPNGAAAFSFLTLAGSTLEGSLSVAGNAYPAVPVISNFAAAQNIPPDAPFTLQWNAFPSATAGDAVVVSVDVDGETVFETPLPGLPGAIAGTATSYQLPAGVLGGAGSGEVSVTFVKVVQRVSPGIDGGTGLAGYFRTTDAPLTAGSGGGGGDTTAPSLVASIPATGAQNVDPTGAVAFTFSEPMQAAVEVQWLAGGAPLDGGGFVHAWSADGRTVTFVRTGGFPASSQVLWALGGGFRDLAGNALPAGTHFGTFTTGAGGGGGDCDDTPLEGDGVFGVSKFLSHHQTSAAAPVADASFPPQFSAFFTPPDGFTATAAQVTPPGKPAETLNSFFGGPYFVTRTAGDAATLDAAYPAGSYSATVTGSGGAVRNLTGSMPASAPPVPQVANFTELQAVNPAQPFTLRWNAFTGATASDFLWVEVAEIDGDTVFTAPDRCKNLELPVTATQVVVPAGTLVAGRRYEGRVIFQKLSTGTPQGSPAITFTLSNGRVTRFPIGFGAGNPGVAPKLVNARWVPAGGNSGSLAFDIEGSPNSSVDLEGGTVLGEWTPIGAVAIPASGTASHQLAPGTEPFRFIRAIAR